MDKKIDWTQLEALIGSTKIRRSDSRKLWRAMLIDVPDLWQALRMDEVLRASAVVEGSAFRTSPRLFIAGSFGTRVTIHDQQWHGLEVAEAVWRLLNPDNKKPLTIAVIGAGFCGTAAAVGLLAKNPLLSTDRRVTVMLFETQDRILPRMGDGACRVHPNAWDWPLPGWDVEHTQFPDTLRALHWDAAEVGAVCRQVREKVDQMRAAEPNELRLIPNHRVRGSDIHTHQGEVRLRVRGEWLGFDAAILCVGFGESRNLKGEGGDSVVGTSFWSTCEPNCGARSSVVVGAGDSALMTAIARATERSPLYLLDQFGELSGDVARLGATFAALDYEYEIERALATRPLFSVWASKYEEAILRFLINLHPQGLWPKWVDWYTNTLAKGRPTRLIVRSQMFHSRSSRINRVLAMLLHASRCIGTKRVREEEFQGAPKRDPELEGDPEYEKAYEVEVEPIIRRLENRGLTSMVDGMYSPSLVDAADLRGLTIGEGFEWIASAGDHIFRSEKGSSAVVSAEELLACVGQVTPPLLAELSNRFDVEDLARRQRDWKWY